MIQDIKPHLFCNHYTEQNPAGDCVFFYSKDGKLLLKETEDGIVYPTEPCACPNPEAYIYLFSVDNIRFFLCRQEADTSKLEKEGYSYHEGRCFRTLGPKYLAFSGITALHLKNWYDQNRYCGRCGRPMEHDHKERMMYCPSCRNMVYPRISPAVIVAVTKGDSLLLTKYAGGSYRRYALIAGYTEIGETAEETVAREVMEETGIRVKNIRYYKSQPWAFSETLLLGFFCEADGEEEIHMDTEELSLARFVKREDIPLIQDGYDDISLTNEMIRVFCRNGKNS